MAGKEQSMQIGFIGIGLMGQGMVINLMKAGHELTVLAHRKRAPIDDVVSRGAKEAKNYAELARGAEIIIICVSTAETVEELIGLLGPHLEGGQIIIDATTSTPNVTRKLAADLALRQVAFADAPMTGGPEQVLAGEAGALVGADSATFQVIEPVIASYCGRVAHFGPVGSGHMAKLISNYLACGMVALIADSYGAARRAQIDWAKLYDVQIRGSTKSGALKKMIGPALSGNFDGYRFSIANAAKDMRYYCDLAKTLGQLTPLARAAQMMLQSAVERGHGTKNVSRLLEDQGS
jgi:3-hydroxyisobutyrate dehydrogenase-like beta-hydroxyacid dehydrogenase